MRRNYGVERTDLCVVLVFVDAGVGEAVILVSLELVHGVVHAGAVEHVEAEQQLEIVLGQAGDLLEQFRSSLVMTSLRVCSR